jgi:CheY-like chemotaxis protein
VREVLQRQTLQMSRLVDDLLDVSRITRAAITLNRHRIVVVRLLRESVDASLQWMQARRQTLTVSLPDDPIEMDADAVRLSQVIQNLLHNAAKFTPVGGKVELGALLEGAAVVIRVKDTGIGMSPEVLESAFELFRQGDQGIDRPEGGLGIGLTLVKRLVGLHGGTVEARSEGPSKGSEFVVRLPLAEEPGAQAGLSSSGVASPAPRRRILIVDDNADAANALRYLLQNDGHHVELASDGSSGLALAHRLKPDVLLLDIGLPQLNGYDFARQVRSDESLKNATLIAITGYGQPGDQLRAAKAGFDHHMTKPIEFQQLQELLRSG